jgi:hypothetical protein
MHRRQRARAGDSNPGERGRRALPVVADARAWEPALTSAVAEVERQAASARLAEGTEAGAIAAAEQAAARALRLAAGELERRPPPAPIACEPGCPHCCHAKVIVFAPEALRLAAHLRAALGPGELEALRERVAATDARTRGTTRAERAELRLPCPLVDDAGSCSVHAVRPLHCIGWSSLDLAACERSLAGGAGVPSAPVYAPQYELANAIMGGLAKACFEAGLDGAPLELVAALRIALDRPNAGERWLRRLPVFSQARDAELAARLGR